FKYKLLAPFDDLDDELGGLLINGENYQGLQLINTKFHNSLDCIHIDPPYNTDTSGFLYKNNYRHSGWMSFMFVRVLASKGLLKSDGVFFCHIDHNEYENLSFLMDNLFNVNQGTVMWDKRHPAPGSTLIARQHEYIVPYSKEPIKLQKRKTNAK